MEPKTSSTPQAAAPSSGLQVALAWIYVGVPLLWGVSQTFIKALALFK
ncbi:MFS transporter small subunit [Hymenobacter metallicola]|nr:hypothetical protein [Hymenobacter metallicola]